MSDFDIAFQPMSVDDIPVVEELEQRCFVSPWSGQTYYNELVHNQLSFYWVRIYGLVFALGVATGIVQEFEFGTNWSVYSRFVGNIFGSLLAAEGVFAFFLESGFLAVVVFGWDRVGKKMHFFATLMVALGSIFSAVWIVVANSWMQTPAGFHIVLNNGLAQIA